MSAGSPGAWRRLRQRGHTPPRTRARSEHTPPTPAPVVSTDSRSYTPSGMPSPWGWRVFASAVVLGLVLAVACLAAGLLAFRLLATA